jgi:Right handed beta helix region
MSSGLPDPRYMTKSARVLILALISIPIGSSSVFASATYIVNPDNYLARVRVLEPGANLRLMPGEYRNGLPVQYLRGTAEAPITIAGPETGPRAVFLARRGHNTVSIVNSSYVTIRDVDLEGQNLPVDGVKCEGHADWAHHITLDGLHVRGHGNNQQTVAISTKCPAWGWVIRNSVITGAGTGLYLGNSDGRAPFIAGLIEYNLIADTIGYNLQIKQQQPRSLLPDMPRANSATTIRHNVFSKTSGGSKETARPNVLVGHWPLAGFGSNDLYLVYGNFFYQNQHESLFQGEGNIALYNNLFVNHSGDAVRIRPHNDIVRKISVFYNTVVATGAGIMLERKADDPPYQQWIEGNAVFARTPITGLTNESNLVGTYLEAAEHLANPYAPLGELNLFPNAQAIRAKPGNHLPFRTFPEAELDFDRDLHGTAEWGAYARNKKSPRWLPTLEIIPVRAR